MSPKLTMRAVLIDLFTSLSSHALTSCSLAGRHRCIRITLARQSDRPIVNFRSVGRCLALSVLGIFPQPSLAASANEIPELVLQIPHAGAIQAIAVSQDGHYYATASRDTTVALWNARTGLMERVLRGHTKPVTDIFFSPDGAHLASSSEDGTIRIWSTEDGRTERQIDLGTPVLGVVWSPNGLMIAAGTASGASAWSASDGHSILRPLAGGSSRGSVAFNADGTLLLDDRFQEVGIVNTQTGSRSNDIVFPSVLRAGSGGKYIAGGGNQIGVLDAVTLKPIRVIPANEGMTKVAVVSPNGAYVAASIDGKHISVWEMKSGKEIFRWDYSDNRNQGPPIGAIAFNAEGTLLLAGGTDGQLHQFDFLSQLLVDSSHPPLNPVSRVDYAEDGTLFVVSPTQALALRPNGVIDSATIPHDDTTGFCSFGTNFALQPGSENIGYCDVNGVSAIDLKTRHYWSLIPRLQFVTVAWSPNGTYFAAMTNRSFAPCNRDSSPSADTPTLKFVLTKTAHIDSAIAAPSPSCIQAMAFSPDEKTLVAGTTEYPTFIMPDESQKIRHAHLEYWDVQGRKIRRQVEVPDKSVVSVAVSQPDSLVAALLSSGDILLLDLDGKELHRWHIPEAATNQDWTGEMLAFSHDGTLLAVSSGDTVRVLKTHEDYSSVASIPVMSGNAPHELAFDPGNSRLAVSEDSVVVIVDLKTTKPVGQILLSGSGGYFMANNDGYYFSFDMDPAVAFRLSGTVYPFDEFDLRYNRPDLVLSAMGVQSGTLIDTYRRAYLKRLQRSGISEQTVETPFSQLPKLTVSAEHKIPGELHLALSGRAAGSRLKEVLIRVNGSPWPDTHSQIPAATQSEWSGTRDVPLSPGMNTVQVAVRDSVNRSSLRHTERVFNPTRPTKPRLFLLAIGVSHYQDTDRNLSYADVDAQTLVRFFTRQRGAFSQIQANSLVNEQATRDGIRNAALQLKAARQDDQVIIFLSGHGLLDTNLDYYFAGFDMDFAHPQVRGLGYAELDGILSSIPSRHKLLLIDSCHGGEVDELPSLVGTTIIRAAKPEVPAGTRKGFPAAHVGFYDASKLMEGLFTDLNQGSGASVIAASEGTQLSYESDRWKNGAFTYTILQGLDDGSADLDHDGYIRLEELRRFVENEVPRLTQGAQQPSARAINSWDNPFIAMPDRLLDSFSHSWDELTTIATSPDAKIVAAIDSSGLYRAWDTDSGAPLGFYPGSSGDQHLSFSSKQQIRVVNQNTVLDCSFNGESCSNIGNLPFGPGKFFEFPRAFNPPTERFAAHNGNVSTVVDGKTSAILTQWPAPNSSHGWYHFAFSSDGSLVAQAVKLTDAPATIEVRDAVSGTTRWQQTLDDVPGTLAFSNKGDMLAVGSTGERVYLFDLRQPGKSPLALGSNSKSNDGVFAVTFNNEGSRLAAGSSDGAIHVWTLPNGDRDDVLANGKPVSALSFDSSSSRLAVADQSGFVRIWDLSAGQFDSSSH